ncbi:MAG: lactate utilization protein [candidate division Zixibacteria bacterium]|nr:lactate utilization protein [candidate division Zixibacteria bacterium]
MDKSKLSYYEKLVSVVLQNLKNNYIDGFYCRTSEEAKNKVLNIIPPGASIGMAGSVTLKEIGVMDELMQGGWKVYNQYLPGLSSEESLKIRKEGLGADYFLTGTNAITLKGELVNMSGMSNKIVGLTNSKKVILVAGVNKIVKDVKEGIERIRNLCAPVNAKRVNFETPCGETGFCDYDLCRPPKYRRMCNQLLITEGDWEKDRITVVLVGEELGF